MNKKKTTSKEYCGLDPMDEPQLMRELIKHKDSLDELPIDFEDRFESIKEERERKEEEREIKIMELKEELKKCDENLSHMALDGLLDGKDPDELKDRIMQDPVRRELEEKLSSTIWKDNREGVLDEVIERLEDAGYLTMEDGNIKITSRGANLLSRHILGEVVRDAIPHGGHRTVQTGKGSTLISMNRPYEPGDDYDMVDLEATLINAIERLTIEKLDRLMLKQSDFMVYKTKKQSSISIGIIIDKSGSMRENTKLDAAIDTAMALFELVRTKYPEDRLRFFVFTDEAKEVERHEIVNASVGSGYTDIKKGLLAFRRASIRDEGMREAYLITDAEPNYEDGVQVGFDTAARGIIEELKRYRQNNIRLKIIMLDKKRHLREFAHLMAKKSLGKVLFVDPQDLSRVVVKDYLRSRERIGI
ncbi:MAG: vWA domain-containing protein [Candidatus Syntropharchaeales archaeon]